MTITSLENTPYAPEAHLSYCAVKQILKSKLVFLSPTQQPLLLLAG